MKSLYLIRHAKSDWNSPAGDDHERPLNPRGTRAARLLGRFLRAVGQPPDAILTSSALRARTTVELMSEAGGFDAPVTVTRALYESQADAVLDEIRQSDDAAERLLVAGHQPTWSSLVELLARGRVKMVTAALARIDFEASSWRQVTPDRGTLVFLLPPRLLTAAAENAAEWTRE